MNHRLIKLLSIFACILFLLPAANAQLGKITFDLDKDKPQKYKTKVLKSEKTGQKKFNLPRKFIQNTVSHYNYYYNANYKLNQVIERARIATKDDYSKLLPFYAYSLQNTSVQKTELDSVIYKATAGILLHDLRSNWVDNLYMLIGEAYYMKRDFDSAAMTFQFINYNLYPRNKKNEDDQMVVGSNDNGDNHAVSVSTKENRNIIQKAFTQSPSRNDALIWQIRTSIETGEFGDAAGLINTLQNDPSFPERLKPSLEEMSAYWFYKQQMYDSCITHFENALQNASDLQDKARREYLTGQLLELNNQQQKASQYYDKASKQTTDPLMDIYANLNEAKMLKSKDPAEIDKSIARLRAMSKRDRFEAYRDIIFFSAAQLALLKPDTAEAVALYKKSTLYNQDNVSYKNKAFLTLAEISYKQKKYKDAYNFYDSLQLGDTSLGDVQKIQQRKLALAAIVRQINIIEREDSLQNIAAMTPADRDAFLKKLSKRLTKESGAKEDYSNYGNAASSFYNSKNASSDIFGNNNTSGSDWYFYNNTIKAKGYADFKTTWGKRQNVDNWRLTSGGDATNLAANTTSSLGSPDGQAPGEPALVGQNSDPLAPSLTNAGSTMAGPVQTDFSIEGLLSNVPVTKEKMNTSNAKVAASLFQLGKNYQNLLEDYSAAVDTYQKSLQRFPDSLYGGELYLNLSYCYRKLGDIAKADFYKNLLVQKFEKSKFTQLALHPQAMEPSKKDTAATNRYKEIYNLFIEGDFDKALQEKKMADSVYGNNYWSPQLLYIQAVYYIKKRDDSTAANTLTQIIAQYPTSPLKEKAITMIDVLKRRKEIEAYLTKLTVTRAKEDSQIIVYDDPTLIKRNVQVQDSATVKKINPASGKIVAQTAVLDSAKRLPAAIKNGAFTFDAYTPQYVLMILNKVDPVYSSEARNALNRYNKENYYSLNLEITKDTLDKERTLLVFTQFETADAAITYLDRLKKNIGNEISWLPANKYTFYIISSGNLELLKQNKDLKSYVEILNKKYPGKF